MDENQHGEAARGIGPPAHGKSQYQSNPMMAPPTQAVGPSVPSYPIEQQYAPQKQRLQEQLNDFWAKQCLEIEETTDFRTHSLPLARIKKIMKADEDVKMISAETPVVFSKACEMFIQDLTMRAWAKAEENKRRTLKKSDIASAITMTDMFDFLVDVVPRDDTTEHQVFAGIPRTGTAPTPTENVPYYHMPPHQQHIVGPPYSAPTLVMGRPILDQNQHGLQTHPSPTPMLRPNLEQQNNHSPNSDD